MKQLVHGAPAVRGVRVGMSTTFPVVDPNAEAKIMRQSAVTSDVVEASYPVWSVLAIIFGALASLAWVGFLVWAVGKILI
jgi:hypothetical protein